MSDNILSAVLTFSLLAGGAAAIGSEMFAHASRRRDADHRDAAGDGHRRSARRRPRSSRRRR